MVRKAIIKLEMTRLYPDDMTDDEITTTAYLITCGVLEPYFNARCCEVKDIQIEDVQSEETETDRPEDV